MTIIKCKMCGGDVALSSDKTLGVCEYCGCSMTVPKAGSEQRLSAFNRGNHFRRIGEFDKALTIYERIVREDDTDAEAHWCCALCRFGIEYVEDPNTYEWFPTCHRVSFDSFLEDVDYKAAVEHSEGVTKRQYIKEGMKIAEVQKGILLTSQNTKPYDIFLCYKETDENGNRTRDSILAQEIYYRLTEQGRSVFFSRITLEDVPGTAYEPYIFAALNSAKVMIVVGTSADYLNSPWVKNEWSRFLTLMKKDRSKLMVPCYRDMDPYDLPEQLGVLQSFDMGKIGFLQDLTHGISKVLDSKPSQKEKIVVQQATANPATLMKRVFFFLEDGDWKAADEYCEKVLDIDPENGEAYFGKLMAEYKISREADISNIAATCLNSSNFQKALRFGDPSVQEKLENIRKDVIYRTAKKLAEQGTSREQQKGNLREAIRQLQDISLWRDSDALIAEYQAQLQKIQEQEEAERQERQRRKQQKEEKRNTVRKKQQSFWNDQKGSFVKKWIVVILCVVILAELLIFGGLIPKLFRKDAAKAPETTQITENFAPTETIKAETQPVQTELSAEELQYRQAEAWEADGQLGRAAIAFGKLGDYSDAKERSFVLWRKITPRKTLIVNGVSVQALRKDGSVATNGRFPAVETRTDIVNAWGGFALLSDGTILCKDNWNSGKWDISGWTDIVDVVSEDCTYEVHTTHNGWYSDNDCYFIGLKMDGTVIATGDNADGQCDVSDWKDIVSITTVGYELTNVGTPIGAKRSTSDHYTVGLKYDGSIVITGKIPENFLLSDWTDIVKISASGDHLAGLKSDGTVVSTYYDQSMLSDWDDITDIDAGPYHLIGLKSDGTAKAVGNNYAHKHLKVEDWTDIVAISASSRHTIGLKSDGTVVAVGSNRVDSVFYGACEVADWTDIVEIDATDLCTIGLKSDGTSVLVGWNPERYFDVSVFANLKMPEKALPARNGNETKQEEVSADKQTQYEEAEQLLADGEISKAAIAFGKLGDYSDAKQRSFDLWRRIIPNRTVNAGSGSTAAIKNDGTVLFTGANDVGQHDARKWTNITEISASINHVVGLTTEGRVMSVGAHSDTVSTWSDIMAIDTSGNSTVGIRTDGTVLSVGGEERVQNWTEIVAVDAGVYNTIGLKADGTVVVACEEGRDYGQSVASSWSDMIYVSTGQDFVAGLKENGTVAVAGKFQGSVADWRDIQEIAAGNAFLAGLTKDGKVVVVVDNNSHDMDGRIDVSDWNDIVSISAGAGHLVGLKENGTLLSTGRESFGIFSAVAPWTDIKLPN